MGPEEQITDHLTADHLTADLDGQLAAERQHLVDAWTALARMRAAAGVLGDVGGDAFSSESLGRAKARRVAELSIDAGTPLFFGRLDMAEEPDEAGPDGAGPDETGQPDVAAETFHVGRRHIRDEAGDPMVIDWRAEVSRAFYQATAAEPRGVQRRRRFGFTAGTLTSFEDEALDRPAAADGPSRILLAEIERPRVGPMRDIVATIQPDQDDIVRAPLAESVCVQGAPGTGKTAVGLHRAAYLLYTYPEQLKRSGVLVIGPNTAFLSYVSAVLPALGEVEVEQRTIDELPERTPVRATDDTATATLKGDARMAEVLRRALYRSIGKPTDSAPIMVGTRRHRIAPELLRRWVDDLRRSELPYATARERLGMQLAHEVRRQLEAEGATPTDAAVQRIARSASATAVTDRLWPAVQPRTLLATLYSDPALLARAARGILDEDEQALLRWTRPPRTPGAARWSTADTFCLDEIAGLLARVPSYGHVIVDEAQDLSAMQCRAIARRAALGSVTVLGDLAQGTAVWASAGWEQTLHHLGKDDAHVEPLTVGYRVPGEVIELANRLLPQIAPGLPPGKSVRAGRGALRTVAAAEVGPAVVEELRAALTREGTVGVIVADAAVAETAATLTAAGIPHDVLGADAAGSSRASVVPASLAKGLEYDEVIVVEPARIVAAEPRGLRRLYVVLTRAVSRLVLVHAEPLPVELAA